MFLFKSYNDTVYDNDAFLTAKRNDISFRSISTEFKLLMNSLSDQKILQLSNSVKKLKLMSIQYSSKFSFHFHLSGILFEIRSVSFSWHAICCSFRINVIFLRLAICSLHRSGSSVVNMQISALSLRSVQVDIIFLSSDLIDACANVHLYSDSVSLPIDRSTSECRFYIITSLLKFFCRHTKKQCILSQLWLFTIHRISGTMCEFCH